MAELNMKLVFDIRWSGSSSATASPAEATRGWLQVRFGDEVVWPEFEWTWIDFLEHLARVWPLLRWQPWPLGLAPATPAAFPKLAEERLHQSTGPAFDAAETEIWSFSEAHDLAHALGGISVPSLWLVPEGAVVHVATERRAARLATGDSLDALEAFVSSTAQRLGQLRDPRAVAAVEAWNRRNRLALADAISLYTGLATSWLRELVRSGDLAAWFELGNRFVETELVAVARATKSHVSAIDLRQLRDAVRRVPAKKNPALSALTAKAVNLELAGKPWEQGFDLAQWLRAELRLSPDAKAEPERLLAKWGVRVATIKLQTGRIDAVACWGPKHGPLVLTNSQGTHARNAAGRRSTLSHEICHLLIDRHEALPLAEAAGGQIAADLEARARAFAAEFLAPKSASYERWSKSVGTPDARLKSLCRHYGVSGQLAAWQLLNSDRLLTAAERSFLERQAQPQH